MQFVKLQKQQRRLEINERERRDRLSVKLGSLSKADAEVEGQSNMNLYFTSEICDFQVCPVRQWRWKLAQAKYM